MARFARPSVYATAMKIIYADGYILENLLWDYLLLRGVTLLRGLPALRLRCALGAALGALYALLTLLPPTRWLCSPLPILAASGFMSVLAFGSQRRLLRSWGCLLALAAAFGGSVLLWGRISGDGWCFRSRLSGAVGLWGLLQLCLHRLEELRAAPTVRCRLALTGRETEFTALRDTGNSLHDPISGKKVLIAEEGLLSPLWETPLPPAEATERLLLLRGTELGKRCRLVSCRSVGGESLLLCFRPDRAQVDGEETAMLVGIFPGKLGEHGALW